MRASSYELLRLLNIGILVILFYFICKSLVNVEKVFRKELGRRALCLNFNFN